MDYKQLETLSNLRRAGEISEEEFNWEKQRLHFDKGSPFSRGNNLNLEENYFLMILHLSQFCGMMFPFIGSVVPLYLWLINKDKTLSVDVHGRIVFNWMFSLLFYALCGIVLSGVVIGLVVLALLIILNIIFVMTGAFRARDGKIYEYPMSISFFKVRDGIEALRQQQNQKPFA